MATQSVPWPKNPPKFKKHVSVLSSTTRSEPSVVLVFLVEILCQLFEYDKYILLLLKSVFI